MPDSLPDKQVNPSENSNKQAFKIFDRSDWLALFAMLISMAALAVSAYEASILREQQQLMQTQQKAAVWPYLLMSNAYAYNATDSSAIWTVKVVNKGVGPALIKDIRILADGKELLNYQELNEYMRPKFPPEMIFALSYASSEGDVLSSNEELDLIKLITTFTKQAPAIFQQALVEVEICYCSIYDDCWLVTQKGVEAIDYCGAD